MNPLHTEFTRLFVAQPQHALLHDATHSPLRSPAGEVRCAVLELARPADWGLLGTVWRGVQADLELPAPAIAINGADGYQLWFAWEHSLLPAQCLDFLHRLAHRYLPNVPGPQLRYWPLADTASVGGDAAFPGTVPARHPHSGQWSAFIAPDLAAVFADEPWLDRDPGVEAQAQLLARLQPMAPQAFAQALQALQPAAPVATQPPATPDRPTARAPDGSTAATYPTDTPTAFLQAVLHDPAAPLALRVQAAVALLGQAG